MQSELQQVASAGGAMLDSSNLYFQRLVERLPAGAYTCDADGLITYYNQRAVQVWGREPTLNDSIDRFCGSFKLFAADGSSLNHDQCWMALALKKDQCYEGEEIIVERPNGQRLVVLAYANPIHDEAGRLIGAVNVLVDISEHSRIEEEYAALLEREQNARQEAEDASQRFSFLAGASRILADSLNYEKTLSRVAELLVPQLADWCTVHIIDENNHVEPLVVSHVDPDKVAWARELQQRYPSKPDPEVGLYKVLHTGQPEFYPDIPEEMLVAGAQDEEHLRLIREVGFTSAMIVPLVSRERTLGALTLVWAESGMHYTANDLELAQELAGRAALAVDNARLYRQEQRFNEALEQRVEVRTAELAASNQELEAFSYSVSHDLRAPLRGIDGFSQALLEDYGEELDETASRYLQRVRAGAQRMGQLIDDLLSFSRLSRSEMAVETVDVSALAKNVFKELQMEGPQRQIEVEIAADLRAEGDKQLLDVVLKNLLENAWKFSSKREWARIEVGTLPNKPEVFFVADNGAGFDMRYADKLFSALQRLHSDRDFEGTGIGLATVQRIIHRHGGRIWAEAEPNKGATFYFTLGTNGAQETAANTAVQ